MSNISKKLGGISLASLTLLALAGCGTNGNVSSNNSTSGSNQPVQVTFWYGLGGALGKDVQAMVDKFNATHPGIHIVATYQGSYSGGGAEQQKLLAAFRAGNQPDIAQIEVHSMPVFASTGKLLDVSQMMAQSAVDNPQNFLAGMLVSTQYNGKYYGVPFNRSVPVMYYNKTLFKQAGISSPPQTMTQLTTDAKKLTHGSGATKVYGFEPLVDWWPWEYSVWSGGGQILSSDLSKTTFASASATRVLSSEQSLVKGGYATVESGPQYWTLMEEDFIHGKVGMMFDSIGSAAFVKKGVGSQFEWGTALLPSDQTLAVPPGGGNVAIMSGIPQAEQQAAWKFIQWWTSPQQTMTWSEMTGYLPVQKAAVQDNSYQQYLGANPQFKTALEELKYQHPAPASSQYLAVLQYVQKALEGIFDEGKPVSGTMQAAQTQADSVLGQ